MSDQARSHNIDLLNPGVIFATLYLLYHGLVFLDSGLRVDNSAPKFAYVSSMGMLGILCGTALAHTHIRAPRARNSPIVPKGPLLYWSIVLALCSLSLLLLMFVHNLGASLFDADSFERASATKGILTGFNFLLPIGAGFSIPLLYMRRDLLSSPFLLLLGMGLVLLFYVSASRGQILHTCLLGMFVYHFCVRRISTKRVLLIALALLLVMIVTGIVRSKVGLSANEIVASLTRDTIAQQMSLSSLEPYKSGVRNMELVKDGPPDGEYLKGRSLLYFIPYLVPRAVSFWDRPEMLDQWYVMKYAPDVAMMGGGLGFSPLIDAYFNFGAAGCFAYFMLFAFALNRLHILAMRTAPFSRLRLLDCLVATTIVAVNRISISGYIKNYLYVFVLAGFLLLTFCLWQRTSNRSALIERA